MSVVVGEQIQAGTGSWSGNPTSYGYQWQYSHDGHTLWTNINGETRSDYIVGISVAGKYLSCIVVAFNAGGSSFVRSVAVGPVTPAPTIEIRDPDPSLPPLSAWMARKNSRGKNHLKARRTAGRF